MPGRKRETIEPQDGDKRYIRRDDEGKFSADQEDVGRSSAQDQKRDAASESTKGHGDRGDRKD